MSFYDADFDTARGPMLFTEEEAKHRWCPFARVAFVGGMGTNRVSTLHQSMAAKQAAAGDDRDLQYFQEQIQNTNCIASGCMAWRVCGVRLPNIWQRKEGDEEEERLYGFCGLGGKVEV